jgi:hypothetical protein
MMIKRREWLSECAQEAILFIGNDRFECAAFSQPCNLTAGDSLTEPLLAMSVKGVIKQPESVELAIRRQGESFAHDVVARVTNPQARIVSVGSIEIELDEPLPGDISLEDVIQFSCRRLDVIA